MANTTNLALAAAGVAVAGQWSQEKSISPRIIVAGSFLALSLAVVSELDEKLATQFAVLILVTSLLVYGKPIIDKTGVAK